MSFVLDGALIVLALLFVFLGYRRGFIKSVIRLLGFVAALVAAVLISVPLSQWIYDGFFHTQVETYITEKAGEVAASSAGTLAEQVDGVIATLPQSAQDLLTMYGVQTDGFEGAAQSVDTLIPTVMQRIVTPLCTAVLQLVVFLILFIVLFIAVRLVGALLDKVFTSLPIIKQANGLLGAVLGFAEGILMLLVVCSGVQLFMTFVADQTVFTTSDIEQTYIMRYLMEINPFL